jgi:quinol monooxygenase YgiN
LGSRTVDYRATVDIEGETVLRFFEQYEDAAAFESHTRTDHSREFEAAFPESLASEPGIVRFSAESAAELEV